MRLSTSALGAAAAVGLVACSGGNLGFSTSSLPNAATQGQTFAAAPFGIKRLQLAPIVRDKKSKGTIFVGLGSGYEVLGYRNPNRRNRRPDCIIGSRTNYYQTIGIGADPKGNLIVPATTPGGFTISVFDGCGNLEGAPALSSGTPIDATSYNASRGLILVAEGIAYSTRAGALVRCSISRGCGPPFSNAAVTGIGFGVAIAANFDCWLSAATNDVSGFVLVYFPKCSGPGQKTNASQVGGGALFRDDNGNLGSIDSAAEELYVYSGCNPTCTTVSTSALQSGDYYGKLNKAGNELAVGNYNGWVDVYGYSPTSGATFLYYFYKGLTLRDDVQSAAFDPADNWK